MHLWGWIFSGLTLLLLAALLVLLQRLRQSRRLQTQLRQEYVGLQAQRKIIYDFLHDLGGALTEEIDRDRLARVILTCARRITGARGAALYLWDLELDQLRAVQVSGVFPPLVALDARVADQFTRHPADLATFLSRELIPRDSPAVIAEVARTGIAAHIERAELDPRFPAFPEKALQTAAYLAVPLISQGRPLGVLALANREKEGSFSSTDLELVKSIADQAAFSLQQTQLYAQLADKQKLDHEIAVAREIQRLLLPGGTPVIVGFQCAALNLPAEQVSGDYFDFIQVDATHWGVVVADVSGKGVPAALIMTMCRSVLRSKAEGNRSPAQVLRAVNAQLYPDIREDMFITMTYLILGEGGRVTLARAGHEAPLLCRHKFQDIEKIIAPGMALGIDSGPLFNAVIADVDLQLAPLDALVVYTDGINEAHDHAGLEFGVDKLTDVLRQSGALPVEKLVKSIIDQVQAFSQGHPQDDDITLAVLQRAAGQPEPATESPRPIFV